MPRGSPPPSPSDARLKLIAENLSIARGERLAVEGLSFETRSGEALAVMGPNGSGKTTLLRALAGFIAPAAGTIRVTDGDPERSIGEQCHFIGHANGLKAALTVAENAAFWAAYLGGDRRDGAVTAALEAFALANLAHVPVRYLSAGQKRRACLSRLLAAPRPIWLLDEPTAALDAASQGLLFAAVDAHTASGGIAIAATHLPLVLKNATGIDLD